MQRNDGEFALCCSRCLGRLCLQEGLAEISIEQSSDITLPLGACCKVARFLNMVGLLAEFLGINSNKDRASFKLN